MSERYEKEYKKAKEILATGGISALEKSLELWECACLGPLNDCYCINATAARKKVRSEYIENISKKNEGNYYFQKHAQSRPKYMDEDIWNRVYDLPIEEGKEEELIAEVARLIMMERWYGIR